VTKLTTHLIWPKLVLLVSFITHLYPKTFNLVLFLKEASECNIALIHIQGTNNMSTLPMWLEYGGSPAGGSQSMHVACVLVSTFAYWASTLMLRFTYNLFPYLFVQTK
jgi:hypothetical protein